LQQAGYPHVLHLSGGIVAWEKLFGGHASLCPPYSILYEKKR
jgi:predicted sulfurtransferase